jgi:cytochrome c553
MRNLYIFLLAGLCSLGGMATQAADLKAGQALHEAHCLKCHDSSVYTRDNRKVNSLAGLRKQVQRCELSLGLTWYDDEVENVVQYLNGNYYKVQ